MAEISRLDVPSAPRWARLLLGAAGSLAAVGLVTLAIAVLEQIAPVLSLGVLYVFAVLPVAALGGLAFALPVSVVSMLAFNWFFLPPTHTFRLADSENWVALAVYLVTAVSVSELAARARRRAEDAEQQRREAAFAADVSARLLEGGSVESQLERVAVRLAALLHVRDARVELSTVPGENRDARELVAGGRQVGRVYLAADEHVDPQTLTRVLSVLASLLATAVEAEELRRSDAVKTAVLRSLSHDLRSPITAILTASEVLEGAGHEFSAAERRELLDAIGLQVRRLDRLVANLLDLSRLEAGAARPLPELWTVDSLVAGALEAIGPEHARVDVQLPADLPPVWVDAAQLEQALVNLLENALKFSSPSDSVEVRSEHADGEVVIRVIDHGPGIPADERSLVFEPFTCGSGDAVARGSGLGLAISRGFVQVNGGRLWVEPSASGAVFALNLPAVPLPARTTS